LRAGDVDLAWAELGVVEEEGGLGGGLLLEGDSRGLDAALLVGLGGEGEGGDLAAARSISLLFYRYARSFDPAGDGQGQGGPTYQNMKKSRTSFSEVSPLMFLTWTVVDMMKCDVFEFVGDV
jgi:hypothetical protein